jgi:hypothetical protein
MLDFLYMNLMRYLGTAGILIVGLVTIARFGCTTRDTPPNAQAKIQVVGDSVYEFETLYQGEKVEVTFQIKNVGTGTLAIDKVESSCGCTVALTSADRIPPNGIAKIYATFNSSGFLGQVRKYVYVFSNDPEKPELDFEIMGNVLTEIDLDPAYLVFEQTAVGKPVEARIKLRNTTSKSITLVGIENPYESLKVDFTKRTLQPSDTLALNATMRPKEAGSSSGSIKVLTDSEKQKVLEIKFIKYTLETEPSLETTRK